MMTPAGWLRIARMALATQPAETASELQARRDEVVRCITMLEQEKVHLAARIRAARRKEDKARRNDGPNKANFF